MQIRARARGEEGAAAVEFALIASVLAMLIFGMLQFGLAFFQLQNLRAATREGARVGAVGGTQADITSQVEDNARVGSLAGALYIQTRTAGGQPQATSDNKPCQPVGKTAPDSVIAGIDLQAAPQSLQNIFTVDIPLLPQIDLRSAQVEGEFRCES